MKKTMLTIVFMICAVLSGTAQDVFGKWKTIDDESGEAKSIVEIYQQNGKVYGKVIEIRNASKKNATCVEDRKSVVYGKSADLGGRRIIKKKKKSKQLEME